MEGTTEQWVIPEGTDVVDVDGDKVGKVIDAQGDYLVVEKGWLFPKDYYVPRTAIATYDGDKAYLAVTKDQALNQTWDVVPDAYVAEDRAIGTVPATRPVGTTGWSPRADADYDVLTGKDVYSAEGDKVGTVRGVYHPAGDFAAGVGRHYFLLDPGLLREWFGGYDEVFVPESAIDLVTTERVDLGLTKDQIKGQNWTTRPADLDTYRWV